MYMDIQMPWLHGCKRAAHSPKNLSMALSAEVAEIVEHFQLLSKRQDLITLILVNDSHLSPTPLITPLIKYG